MPPYLGVAYYPEDWDESVMEYDIAMMKKANINVARIAEFSWSKMESEEGVFSFDWLHKVVDKLGQAGIATVMCTPTATPPRWLSLKHPDAMVEKENGRVRNHGGRRDCCSNNPNYIKYSLRITKMLGREFGNDENVIGWQLDNEIRHADNGCFCSICQEKFKEYLRKKFGTAEALNQRWNLGTWSQEYNDIDDIPAPRDAWVNPHHRKEWNTFQQESNIEFIGMQADVLKKYTKAPIGTDMMAHIDESYVDMNRKLDVVQFNHYDTAEALWGIGFWFDFLRTVKDRPFWNTETSTCWNGSRRIKQTIKPEGFCYVNSWLPLALGGEANMYWLWRTHWGGHELMHGSVLSASGRPMHIFEEVQKVGSTFAKAAEFLNNTKVVTPVAMHFTSLAANTYVGQTIFEGFDYKNLIKTNFHKPLSDSGVRVDVIESEHNLNGYKLLFTNLVPSLEDSGMRERIVEWVKQGGVWVVGPITDVRNADGARYKDRPYGMLEEMTGIKWLWSVPDFDGTLKCNSKAGKEFVGENWFELCEEDADTLASVTQAPHSKLIGNSIFSKKKVGKGYVYFLGTIPSYQTMKEQILPEVMAQAGLTLPKGEFNGVFLSPRKGKDHEGFILVDSVGNGGKFTLPYPVKDLLTNTTLEGEIAIAPYEVLVLKKCRGN